MIKRQQSILKILTEDMGRPVTAQDLSLRLNVSVRTIKSDIKAINELNTSIIKSSNRGYYMDQGNPSLSSTLQSEEHTIPQTPVERVRFMINHLLESDHQFSSLDFADLLFVSSTTIKNDLNLLQEIIARYHLKLSTTDTILSILGKEHYKRRLLVDLLYDELEMRFFSLESIADLFPTLDSNFVKETIIETLGKYGYLINDFGLYSSIIHICVKIVRMQKGYFDPINEVPPLVNENELKITADILSQLETCFSVSFSESDFHEIGTLIISKAYRFDASKEIQENIWNNIDTDALDLARSIITSINEHFSVNIDNDDFLVGFSMHLQNLKTRIKHNSFSHNPLTDSIKLSSPMIYEIGVYVANLIRESLDVIITDGEVAFLAIHIGYALQSQRIYDSKINTYLVIPTYYSYSQNLISRLTSLYLNDLNIVKIINSTDYLFENEKPDLVISVFPQPTDFMHLQWVKVSLFFTPNDQTLIENKIVTIQKIFKREEFSRNIEQLITPDLFFVSHEKKDNLNRVLSIMCNQLKIHDFVEDDFLANVMKREELSSTAYFSFAIPHSIKMDAKRTCISIYVNENGIDWNGKLVQLVILPCFNSVDRKKFSKIFEMFSDTLVNSPNIKSLVSVSNLEEFTIQLKSLV